MARLKDALHPMAVGAVEQQPFDTLLAGCARHPLGVGELICELGRRLELEIRYGGFPLGDID